MEYETDLHSLNYDLDTAASVGNRIYMVNTANSPSGKLLRRYRLGYG